MFSEKDIKKQDSSSLKKGLRSFQKRIEEHINKINDPNSHVPELNNLKPREQNGLTKHWKKEIRNFKESISNRIAELKERGDYDG